MDERPKPTEHVWSEMEEKELKKLLAEIKTEKEKNDRCAKHGIRYKNKLPRLMQKLVKLQAGRGMPMLPGEPLPEVA